MQRMNDGAKPGGLPSQYQNPEAAMLAQSENSTEGLPGKTPGKPDKGSFQKWLPNLFLKSSHHQWGHMTQYQHMNYLSYWYLIETIGDNNIVHKTGVFIDC